MVRAVKCVADNDRSVLEWSPGQDAVLEKLDEIRDELRRLRRAVEERSPER